MCAVLEKHQLRTLKALLTLNFMQCVSGPTREWGNALDIFKVSVSNVKICDTVRIYMPGMTFDIFSHGNILKPHTPVQQVILWFSAFFGTVLFALRLCHDR